MLWEENLSHTPCVFTQQALAALAEIPNIILIERDRDSISSLRCYAAFSNINIAYITPQFIWTQIIYGREEKRGSRGADGSRREEKKTSNEKRRWGGSWWCLVFYWSNAPPHLPQPHPLCNSFNSPRLSVFFNSPSHSSPPSLHSSLPPTQLAIKDKEAETRCE